MISMQNAAQEFSALEAQLKEAESSLENARRSHTESVEAAKQATAEIVKKLDLARLKEQRIHKLKGELEQAKNALSREQKEQISDYHRRLKIVSSRAKDYNQAIEKAIKEITEIDAECNALDKMHDALGIQGVRPIGLTGVYADELKRAWDSIPGCDVSSGSPWVKLRGKYA